MLKRHSWVLISLAVFGCGSDDESDESASELAIDACISFCQWSMECQSLDDDICDADCEAQYESHAEGSCLHEWMDRQTCRDASKDECTDDAQSLCLAEENAFEACEL